MTAENAMAITPRCVSSLFIDTLDDWVWFGEPAAAARQGAGFFSNHRS